MVQRERSEQILPHTSAETAFVLLASPLVEEALEQARVMTDEPTPEGLHNLRVALRRMRSLWWSYRPLLDKGENTRQRALFKSLADAAGKPRDYDILIELLEAQRAGKEPLSSRFVEARQVALKSGQETLANADIRRLLPEALAEASRTLDPEGKQRLLQEFAGRRVEASEKTLRRCTRRAGRVKKAEYTALHDVRKAGKKVRYLLELFGPVLSGRHQETLKRLRKVQDKLGELNDVVASENLLRDNAALLSALGNAESTLAWFRKERKRRMRAAASILRKIQ
jgi:CHAD domain-containing protein